MKKEYKGRTHNGFKWVATLCRDYDEYEVYIYIDPSNPVFIGFAPDQAAIHALLCEFFYEMLSRRCAELA
jgi:preprotein translocase subunit Sec61beta